MKSQQLPKGTGARNLLTAAEGATDKELVLMPAQTTDRLLEATKVKAYILVGFGYR